MDSNLINRVSITELVCTCPVSPTQLEGRLSNGWHLHARSRFGATTICIAETEEDSYGYPNAPDAYYMECDTNIEDMGGYHCIAIDQLRVLCQLFVSLIDW